jgi:hypothetical protein
MGLFSLHASGHCWRKYRLAADDLATLVRRLRTA